MKRNETNINCMGEGDAVGYGAAVVARECQFPFVLDFGQVVNGAIPSIVLRSLELSLQVHMDVLDGSNNSDVWGAADIHEYAVAAKAAHACYVALACRDRVAGMCDRSAVDTMMTAFMSDGAAEKLRSIDVDAVDVGAFDYIYDNLWKFVATQDVIIAEELLSCPQLARSACRFRRLGDLLIESQELYDRELTSLTPEELILPVVPSYLYRRLVTLAAKCDRGERSGEWTMIDFNGKSQAWVGDGIDTAYGFMSVDTVMRWMSVVLLRGTVATAGTCYLKLFHPRERLDLYNVYADNFTVDDLYACNELVAWTHVQADVRVGDGMLHVYSLGRYPVGVDYDETYRIAGFPDSPKVDHRDFYAEALWNDFVLKHTPTVTRPVEEVMHGLSLDERSSGVDPAVNMAHVLYEGVDKELSPRAAEVGSTYRNPGMLDDQDGVDGLLQRLSNGSVITERYFRRCTSRWRRLRPAPRLESSVGSVIHLFGGAPAESTSSEWLFDTGWDVPGWTSYVVHLRPSESALLSYCHDETVDIRIDCCGPGFMNFGFMRTSTRDNVVWFTQSVKFTVHAREHVTLRLSVPDIMCMAIGQGMRRYLNIPGYATAIRVFDPGVGRHFDTTVELQTTSYTSGCRTYVGKTMLNAGRHRIRMTGLASGAPMKLVLATEKVSALHSLRAASVTVYPRTDYISVMLDEHVTVVEVEISKATEVKFSMLQIVNVREFEMAVNANAVASK